MNYEKIYADFVADRKAKEPALIESGEYFESHHITPKSLGGSDDADNLIALSASDHYFAHLCLAKIHGGHQWYSVTMMADMRKAGRVGLIVTDRHMVAVARRERAKNISGAMTKYSFDDVFAAAQKYKTRNEWAKSDFKTYDRAQYRGWLDDCCAHMTEQRKPHNFWTKTRVMGIARTCKTIKEFREKYGSVACAAQRNGWYTEATANMKDVRRTPAKNRKKVINKTTGDIYESCHAAAKSLGVSPSAVSQAANAQAKTKGYELAYI